MPTAARCPASSSDRPGSIRHGDGNSHLTCFRFPMCLIQDVPTLGRHPVKRVHAAVPSAAEDDFPCLRDKSARSCLRPSADGLSEPLDADHAPAMFWVAPARPSACAALALRTLPPRSARLAGVAARKQERYVLMLMTKRLNGLSRFGKLSRIRDIPYPGRAASVDVAPGRRWNSTSAAHGHPLRGQRKPGALACHGAPDSAGLAPDQRPRRASGHRPRLALSCLRQ